MKTGIELGLQRFENKSLALNPGLSDKNGGFYFEIEVGFPAFPPPGMPVVLGGLVYEFDNRWLEFR